MHGIPDTVELATPRYCLSNPSYSHEDTSPHSMLDLASTHTASEAGVAEVAVYDGKEHLVTLRHVAVAANGVASYVPAPHRGTHRRLNLRPSVPRTKANEVLLSETKSRRAMAGRRSLLCFVLRNCKRRGSRARQIRNDQACDGAYVRAH